MPTTTSETVLPSRSVAPEVQTANYTHLYWDVAWYGVAYGSTLSFLPVFAARLDAAGWQVGFITAGPALVNTLFTMGDGRWLENRPLGRAVIQTAVWSRLGYFLLIPVSLGLPFSARIWAVLLLTLLMAIPGTALAVGFNALLAATVPPEARGRVVGRRNALMGGTIMTAFLLSGWILDQLSFEWGYAVVFALGALGGGMSTYHLSRIKVPPLHDFQMRPTRDQAQPGRAVGQSGDALRLNLGLRLWMRWRPGAGGFLAGISARYGWVMLAFFMFHFSQFLPVALFPIFWVNEVHLSDGEIGVLNAFFYLVMLIFSPLLEPLTKRFGSYHLVVFGAIGLSSYPIITGLSYGLPLLLVASAVGGTAWAILSGAMINRLMEVTPEDKRPSHYAVYNLALNVATLAGTMLGPVMATMVGIREALFIVFILRIASGVALARWG